MNYIQAIGNATIVNTFLLHRGVNSTIDITELAGVLDKVGKEEFVVMAVQPIQAYEIWKAARDLVRIDSCLIDWGLIYYQLKLFINFPCVESDLRVCKTVWLTMCRTG